jgi:hypothetical protein
MGILKNLFGPKAAVAPRYPFLRRFLLERCRNREAVEPALARHELHEAERAMIQWGRDSVVRLLEQFPDLGAEQEDRIPAQRDTLRTQDLPDGLPTAFSLWSPLVEWELDLKRREIRCTFETYEVSPDTSKFDFSRKRLATATLRID